MVWYNSDGLIVRYGQDYRGKVKNKARAEEMDGPIKVCVADFDLTKIPSGTVSYSTDRNNDGTLDGFTKADLVIPAYAHIVRVSMQFSEAAAGGTSFTVGTYQEDGTAINATGLVTATEGVLANANAIGKWIQGAGALATLTSGAGVSVGAVDSFIGISTTGTFTAGKGKLIIEYSLINQYN